MENEIFQTEVRRRLDETPDQFLQTLAHDQIVYRSLLTTKELAATLSVHPRTAAKLRLGKTKPYVRTGAGLRPAWRYSWPDVVQFVSYRNPSFSDFSMSEGALLRPRDVVTLCALHGHNYTLEKLAKLRASGAGPEFVAITKGTIRYRKRDVLHWLQLFDDDLRYV